MKDDVPRINDTQSIVPRGAPKALERARNKRSVPSAHGRGRGAADRTWIAGAGEVAGQPRYCTSLSFVDPPIGFVPVPLQSLLRLETTRTAILSAMTCVHELDTTLEKASS
jgi:hypothetical protein